MLKKIILLIIFVLLFFISQNISAQNVGEVAEKIEEYQKKLTDLGRQRDTLSAEIQYMTLQINLTALKIQETEEKIISTQKEVEILTTRIRGLDTALSHLSKLLLKKMVESYKNKPLTFFDILFNSQNANDFIGKVKYLKTAQENNQKLLIQVQETKINFEEQKKIRQIKKEELDLLEKQLIDQKNDLNYQKVQKDIQHQSSLLGQ